MPVDFTGLLETLDSGDRISADAKGTWIGRDKEALKSAVSVVQAVFPDYIQKNSVKISAGSPQTYNSIADYSLLGHSIRVNPEKVAGAIYPSVGQYVPTEAGLKAGKKAHNDINFTTDEVMTNVNTLLHEFYHSRTGGGWAAPDRIAAEKQFGITDEIKKDVAKMATSDPFNAGNLYSIRPEYLDTEEFLANAVSLMDMRDRKIMPERGGLAEKLQTIDSIVQKYPQMGKFIENQRQPDIPSLKSGAPEPGTLGSFIESIFGGPRTTRPGEKK